MTILCKKYFIYIYTHLGEVHHIEATNRHPTVFPPPVHPYSIRHPQYPPTPPSIPTVSPTVSPNPLQYLLDGEVHLARAPHHPPLQGEPRVDGMQVDHGDVDRDRPNERLPGNSFLVVYLHMQHFVRPI